MSERNARRRPRGPFIELLDFDEPASTGGARSGGRAHRSLRGLRLSPPLSRPSRSSGTRLAAAAAVVVVLAGAGIVHVVRRVAASESSAPLPQVEPLAQAQPDAAPVLPPPSEGELAALREGAVDAMGESLRLLRQREVTPEGLHAVEVASSRTTDVELLRRVTCYRVRAGAPLETAFLALPTSPAVDGEWKADGAACLVDAIAARADEAPGRALPVLVERGLREDADTIVAGLARLEVDAVPGPVSQALAATDDPRARRAAIRVAIALGAAAAWPDQVTAWLRDPDRGVRLHAHAELLRQRDDASRRLAALATAGDPADDELTRRAVDPIGRNDGFDVQLAAVAADASQPTVARAHAAELVGLHGGLAAGRRIAAVTSTDTMLTTALTHARLRIDQRFGSHVGRPADR